MIYREIKEDCFAYDLENDTCKCLKMLVCVKEECPFYKGMTEEQKKTFYKRLRMAIETR